MERLFALLKGEHVENRGYTISQEMKQLKRIWNSNWESGSKVPYEALTQLTDAYNVYVERPDLGFLFCWEAINNSYNELLILDSAYKSLKDTNGLKELKNHIYGNYSLYKPYLQSYIDGIPLKLCKYVSSYLLRGYILEQCGKDPKYASSSYRSFEKNYQNFYNAIAQTYGQKALSIASPCVNQTKVELNINKNQYRQMVHSLALKIQEVLITRATQMQSAVDGSVYQVQLTEEEVLQFFMVQIIYASRCNNFHGNVASRLNSIYVNQESYDAYRYIFLHAHMLLGIAMHINGYLTINELDELKKNEKLL